MEARAPSAYARCRSEKRLAARNEGASPGKCSRLCGFIAFGAIVGEIVGEDGRAELGPQEAGANAALTCGELWGSFSARAASSAFLLRLT